MSKNKSTPKAAPAKATKKAAPAATPETTLPDLKNHPHGQMSHAPDVLPGYCE
jgi:hypothetical protein